MSFVPHLALLLLLNEAKALFKGHIDEQRRTETEVANELKCGNSSINDILCGVWKRKRKYATSSYSRSKPEVVSDVIYGTAAETFGVMSI